MDFNLPVDMPQCGCKNDFRDAGFKIQSDQFGDMLQCRNCGGFKQAHHQTVTNTSGLHPLKHAVLVLPYEVEEVTKGGIVLPYAVQERDQLAEQRAIILEIGELADIGDAKVGDKVLFAKWSGQVAIGITDKKAYRVVNDRDIFLRIEDEYEPK